MKRLMSVAGVFLLALAFGVLVPQMHSGFVTAAEDCGIECGPGDGTCDTSVRVPWGFFACCGGHCSQYEGDDPIFHCEGRCTISNDLCECVQLGCHDFCD